MFTMTNFYFTLEGEKQSYVADKFGLDHKNATSKSWSEHEVLDIVLPAELLSLETLQ